jgi:hypothetical protein
VPPKIDERLKLSPPQLGHAGTSSCSCSATANPHDSQLNDPAPARVPTLNDFMVDS